MFQAANTFGISSIYFLGDQEDKNVDVFQYRNVRAVSDIDTSYI